MKIGNIICNEIDRACAHFLLLVGESARHDFDELFDASTAPDCAWSDNKIARGSTQRNEMIEQNLFQMWQHSAADQNCQLNNDGNDVQPNFQTMKRLKNNNNQLLTC
jgi:hypothetical protein